MLTQAAPALDMPVRRVCGSDGGEEIVVCGSRDQRSRYRMPEISTEYERPALRAEVELAPGIQSSIDLQSVELPGGLKGQRVMVTVRTKF